MLLCYASFYDHAVLNYCPFTRAGKHSIYYYAESQNVETPNL